jgi:type II secretory pathway pseudopilin PulG
MKNSTNRDKPGDKAVQDDKPTGRQLNVSFTIDGRTLRIVAIAVVAVLIGVIVPLAVGAINSNIQAQQEAEKIAAEQNAIETRHRTLFNDTADDCLDPGDTAIIADDELSWFVDGKGNDYGSGSTSVEELVCIFEALDMPAPLREQVSNTNSLMGVQTGDWADLSAEWSYHPDNGLDINFEFTN